MSGSATDNVRAEISREEARAWIERWDTQQSCNLPDREDRFTALIDAVEAVSGRPDPLVLDLGCGPGSLAVRLLNRMPNATVIAIDADPVLLMLGRAAWADLPGLVFTDLDLRTENIAQRLDLDRAPDAAVSTTALHWLSGGDLENLYRQLAVLLRPGGLFLNGDHMADDPQVNPVLDRLGRALIEFEEGRRFPDGHAETWTGWWEAVRAEPALAEAMAARERRGLEAAHHGSAAGKLAVQLAALRASGFIEAGTLWQRGVNRLLCGVRSPG